MRNYFLITLCLCCSGLFAQEADVRKAVDTFFEGFHAQDTIKMKSVFAKEMVLHSVAENANGRKVVVESPAAFAKSIASIPKTMKFEERLLSYNIQIDGTMAHAWTPYEFYINGKLSHRGVNSFQMFKDNDGLWKITYIIDTRRK